MINNLNNSYDINRAAWASTVAKQQSQRPFLSAIQPVQQGVPNTTPQVQFVPSTEDMEKALEIINSGYHQASINPYDINTMPTSKAIASNKGAAWDGWIQPENNGTGELIANRSNREDAIPGYDWNNVWA